MTRALMELSLGLYLMIGVEVAEWRLRRPSIMKLNGSGRPVEQYILVIVLGPVWALRVGLFMMAIAIDRGILWGYHLISGEWIRIWSLIIMIAVILILHVASPLMT